MLKRHPFKEADLRVTLLTKEHGKLTLLAKGARKLKHRLCGKLEPFYQLQLEVVRGQGFHYIKEVDVLNSCPLYSLDLSAQNALHFLAELTHRLTAEEQENEAIFELWQALMKVWPFYEAQNEVLLHTGIIKLLSQLGFMASWQHCGNSHEKLDLEQPIYLKSETVSLTHLPHPHHVPLPPTLVKWVNFMQQYALSDVLRVTPSESEKEQVWKLLQGLIYPLLHQPMKTERFLVRS